jgi:hypothetical protein
MTIQNRYQRFRLYTRVAMGKASPMDVAGDSGNTGQLKLLYPLLIGLQVGPCSHSPTSQLNLSRSYSQKPQEASTSRLNLRRSCLYNLKA